MLNLLILLTLPQAVRLQYYHGIKAQFPKLNVNVVDHHSKTSPFIEEADVLVTFGPMMAEAVLENAHHLKWIQALGSGVDGITNRPALKEQVIVTNLHGIHGAPVSEAALMMMLGQARHYKTMVHQQLQSTWARQAPVSLLKGKTVTIYGVGVISAELAPKCKALGMRVLGISSSVRDVAGFDDIVPRQDCQRAIQEADFLVLLTPYSQETHHLINAQTLSMMKSTCHLINLARGGVVQEEDLLRALQSGQIASAALDVFAQEPLPPDHPLWSQHNVSITPHMGGFYDAYVSEALPVITENIKHFMAGNYSEMINIVKRGGSR
jgi:D-2-hydroxyacid dehydrogenase (NADP+)